MKKQLKFQKIACLIMILAGALSAVYCFIFCSGALASFGFSIERSEGEIQYRDNFKSAQELYVDAQPFNNALLILSIVMIVAAALLYITATNKRRKYYISNYVAIGLVCLVDIAASIYALVMDSILLSRFNALMADPDIIEAYKTIAEANANVNFVTSNWNFALGYVVYVIVILACVGLILNLVWKLKLMKGENELLSGKALHSDQAVEEVA